MKGLFNNGTYTTRDTKEIEFLNSFVYDQKDNIRDNIWDTFYGKSNESLISLNKRKDELIMSKFREKGFGHLIEGMNKRRFPKVCAVKENGWTSYFADDDSDSGAFIVAISDMIINPVHQDMNKFNLTSNIYWQDKLPLSDAKGLINKLNEDKK